MIILYFQSIFVALVCSLISNVQFQTPNALVTNATSKILLAVFVSVQRITSLGSDVMLLAQPSSSFIHFVIINIINY